MALAAAFVRFVSVLASSTCATEVCAVARISPMSLIAAWNQKCLWLRVFKPAACAFGQWHFEWAGWLVIDAATSPKGVIFQHAALEPGPAQPSIRQKLSGLLHAGDHSWACGWGGLV